MIKFLLIISIIVFFPIPIILKLNYLDNKIALYLYFKKINVERHVVQKAEKKVPYYIRIIDYEFVKMFFNKLKNNKIKPSVHFKINTDYGFEDPYFTGLFYGILYYLNPIFYYYLQCLFKIKKFDFNLNPMFKERGFKFRIEGIIFVNLVKIINIIVIYIKVVFLRKKPIKKYKLRSDS